jgi:hypothetical protein
MSVPSRHDVAEAANALTRYLASLVDHMRVLQEYPSELPAQAGLHLEGAIADTHALSEQFAEFNAKIRELGALRSEVVTLNFDGLQPSLAAENEVSEVIKPLARILAWERALDHRLAGRGLVIGARYGRISACVLERTWLEPVGDELTLELYGAALGFRRVYARTDLTATRWTLNMEESVAASPGLHRNNADAEAADPGDHKRNKKTRQSKDEE